VTPPRGLDVDRGAGAQKKKTVGRIVREIEAQRTAPNKPAGKNLEGGHPTTLPAGRISKKKNKGERGED